MQETWVWSLGWKDSLEKRMATHFSILAWKIPCTEEPGGYSPWRRKESDMTELRSLHLTHSKHSVNAVTILGLPRWLSGKESACQCRRLGFNPWVGKIPWRRKWQPTPGKSHGQRSLAGYSPSGPQRAGHNWATKQQWLFLLLPSNSQAPDPWGNSSLTETLHPKSSSWGQCFSSLPLWLPSFHA